jgi:hypothetical protein
MPSSFLSQGKKPHSHLLKYIYSSLEYIHIYTEYIMSIIYICRRMLETNLPECSVHQCVHMYVLLSLIESKQNASSPKVI